MKRISKILATGFAVATLGVVISGCGGSAEENGDAPPSDQDQAANEGASASGAAASGASNNLVDTAARLASEPLDGEPVETVETEEPVPERGGAIPVDEEPEVTVDDQTPETGASQVERISVGGTNSGSAENAAVKSRAEELLERAESYAQENKDYKVVTTLRKVDESELDAGQLRKKKSMYQKASDALANTEKGLVVD